MSWPTVYPKKYAHGFCFTVLCCGYTLTDFPISIRLTSLALWQSNDCSSASKETLMNMDKYFMWIHYERLHNHNKAKHNKTVCIFLGIYCKFKVVMCACLRVWMRVCMYVCERSVLSTRYVALKSLSTLHFIETQTWHSIDSGYYLAPTLSIIHQQQKKHTYQLDRELHLKILTTITCNHCVGTAWNSVKIVNKYFRKQMKPDWHVLCTSVRLPWTLTAHAYKIRYNVQIYVQSKPGLFMTRHQILCSCYKLKTSMTSTTSNFSSHSNGKWLN